MATSPSNVWDVNNLWKQALAEYKADTGFDPDHVDRKPIIHRILGLLGRKQRDSDPSIQQQQPQGPQLAQGNKDEAETLADYLTNQSLKFETARDSPESKGDKTRRMITSVTIPLEKLASGLGNLASPIFPPAGGLAVAFTHIMTTCTSISEDFDSIQVLFNILGAFVDRLQIVVNTAVPREEGYNKHVMRVFCAILKFCGKTQHFIGTQSLSRSGRVKKEPKLRRLKIFLDRLFYGGDADLKAVYDDVFRCLSALDSATMMMTLASVVALDGKVDHGRDRIEKELGNFTVVLNTAVTDFRHGSDQRDKDYANLRKLILDGALQRQGNLSHIGQQVERKSQNVELVNQVLVTRAQHHVFQRLLELKKDFVEGTCEWIQEHENYKDLFTSTDCHVLSINGDSGMGKSMLSYYLYDLLLKEHEANSTTSVVYFAFDEEIRGLQSVKNMMYYCAVQVANRDSGYADKAARHIRRYQGHINLEDKYLDVFSARSLGGRSGTLVMILDGVDQLPREEGQKLVDYIKKAKLPAPTPSSAPSMSVRFILTGAPGLEDEFPVMNIDLLGKTTVDNMRKFIEACVPKLPRLVAHPQGMRKKVEDAVAGKAKSFYHARYTLQWLDRIGSASMISRALKALPEDTATLCGDILRDYLAYLPRDTKQEITKLLVWIAHCKTRLSLKAAFRFLSLYSINDTHSAIQGAVGRGSSSVLSIIDQYEDGDVSAESDVEVQGLVGFGDRTFQSYFLKTLSANPTLLSDILGRPVFGLMLEMASDVLTMPWEDNTAPTEAEEELTQLAAKSLFRSLVELPVESMDVKHVMSALNAMHRILTDQFGAVGKLEALVNPSDADEHFCILEDPETALKTLRDLTTRLPSGQTATTATDGDVIDFSKPSSEILEQIAKRHIINWKQATGSRSAFISFRHAHQALFYARNQGILDNTSELANENGGELGPRIKDDSITAETVAAVAGFAGWEQDADYHKQISLALYFDLQNEDALKHAVEGLKKAEANISAPAPQTFELRQRVARTKFTMWNEEFEPNTKSFDELLSTSAAVDGAREVHGLFQAAIETEGLISGSESDNDSLRSNINMCYQMKGRLEVLIDEHRKHAVQTTLESTKFNTTTPIVLRYFNEIIEGLAAKKMWDDVISLLEEIKDEDPLSEEDIWDLTHGGILRAARAREGGRDVTRDLYIKSIPHHLDASNAASLESSLALARFYLLVVEEPALAKATARRVLNIGRDGLRWFSEASTLIADILSAEFRASDQLDQKMSLLRDMEQLVNDARGRYGPDFRVEKAHTRIPLSLMRQRMGPEEKFYQDLEDTFNDCFETLQDDYSQNDPYSFRMLAKTLSLVPGMDTTLAQVALSCQFSIINPARYKAEVMRRNRGDENEGNDGNSTGYHDEGDGKNTGKSDDDDSEHNTDDKTDDESVGAGDTGSSEFDETYFGVTCTMCDKTASGYTGVGETEIRPWYMCYCCAECDLCSECYQERQTPAADRDPGYLALCPDNHKHVRAPVPGWKEVNNEMIQYDGQDPIKLQDWLETVVKDKWKECWAAYWRSG